MEQELPFLERAYFERERHNLLNKSGIDGSPETEFKPSRETVNKILSYSKALKVQKSSFIDSVEVLIN